MFSKEFLHKQDCPCNWGVKDDYANEKQYMLVYPQPVKSLLSNDDRYSIKAVYDRYSKYTVIVSILMCRYSTSRNVYEHLTDLGLPIVLVDFKKIGLEEDHELTTKSQEETIPTICFTFVNKYSKEEYLNVMKKYHSLFENYF